MPEPASSSREGLSSMGRRRPIVSPAQVGVVDDGVEGSRVLDGAERVGIGHAALLHHVQTKRALTQGLLERIAHDLDRFAATSEEVPPSSCWGSARGRE